MRKLNQLKVHKAALKMNQTLLKPLQYSINTVALIIAPASSIKFQTFQVKHVDN